MRYSLSILALAGAVAAQTANFNAIRNPSAAGSTLTVGQQYDITWDYNEEWADDSSILLVGGPATNELSTVGTITTSVANSQESFAWTVQSFQTATVYGFKIVSNSDSTVFQYSFPFYISGDTTSSSTTPTTTTSTAVTCLTKVNVQSTTPARNATWTPQSDSESYSTSASGWEHASASGSEHASASGWEHASASGNGANPTYSVTRSQGGWSGNATAAPTWTTATTPTGNWVAATITTQASAGLGNSAKTGTASPVIATGAASNAVSGGLAMFGGVAMAVLALME